MKMRPEELTCRHGVGHSAEIHGCDGCCSIFSNIDVVVAHTRAEQKNLILELITSEETLMTTKGATFGLNKEYDSGYLTAVKDLKILIERLDK